MICVQTASMASAVNGPGLRACSARMMVASRSGFSTGPSTSNSFLMSPTCWAVRARSFSSWSSCSSISSMRWRRGCKRASKLLSMLSFEFLQEADQCLHTFERHGVVDGSAHATHTLVSLQLQEPARLGLREKLGIERLILEEERYIHARAHGWVNSAHIKIGGVEKTVQGLCLADVLGLNGLNATLPLEPLED